MQKKTTKEILEYYHQQIWTNRDMVQIFLAGIGIGISIGFLIIFWFL